MSLERPYPPDPYEFLPAAGTFLLTSDDIADGRPIPAVHSASGGNVSPQLAWSGFPPETKSFVVTCFDPDAPTACGYWHWCVVDLPASVSALARGAGKSDHTLPGGFHGLTDADTRAYYGSAPPPGDHPHRYMFVVHAVDVASLGLRPGANPTVVAFNLAFHTLARARLTVTFAR